MTIFHEEHFHSWVSIIQPVLQLLGSWVVGKDQCSFVFLYKVDPSGHDIFVSASGGSQCVSSLSESQPDPAGILWQR